MIYPINGLPFWHEEQILIRQFLKNFFAMRVKKILKSMNQAWELHEIEGTLLTPVEFINPNYTSEDIFTTSDSRLVMRPETTPASYAYAIWLLNNQQAKPPLCVWQAGKSFRREQDQVLKNCRFKEFYQQEFQCLYTTDTKMDYLPVIIEGIKSAVQSVLHLPTRTVPSDRIPDYAKSTTDVEIDNADKWMEVCSISVRKDFTTTYNRGATPKEIEVIEIALGLDRLVYNF